MAPQRHHFAGSHIALIVDGDDAKTAYLKSAEGGMFKAATTEEPNAGYHVRGKHASVREIDPLTFEFGMAGSKWALGLVEKACSKPTEAHRPFNGSVLHADTNFKCQYTYEFERARLTEFTLPKLDAKSKESANLKIKVQPESINFSIAEAGALLPGSIAKQKQWLTSQFHMQLTHDGTVMATSIESMTVKIGSKSYQVGGVMNPQYTATGKLEMPKLSFTVPITHAKKLVTWFQKAVGHEKGLDEGADYEQDAIIEYLDTTRKKILYTITLKGVGPETLSIIKGTNEAVTAMKFDCYVTAMEVQASGQGLI